MKNIGPLVEMEGKLIEGYWGYAIIKDGVVWIPAVIGNLGNILEDLYEQTKIKKMIFSAILNPVEFRKHLKNIKREWDEWWEEMGDFTHCIEIEYDNKKR